MASARAVAVHTQQSRCRDTEPRPAGVAKSLQLDGSAAHRDYDLPRTQRQEDNMPDLGNEYVETFETWSLARARLRELAAELGVSYSLTLQPIGWFAYRIRAVRI